MANSPTLDAPCDWGFAGDCPEATYLILQAGTSDDYVLATGEGHSVRDFCEQAFADVGLAGSVSARRHVWPTPRSLQDGRRQSEEACEFLPENP